MAWNDTCTAGEVGLYVNGDFGHVLFLDVDSSEGSSKCQYTLNQPLICSNMCFLKWPYVTQLLSGVQRSEELCMYSLASSALQRVECPKVNAQTCQHIIKSGWSSNQRQTSKKPARDSRSVRRGATLAEDPKGCYHPADQRMTGERQLKVTRGGADLTQAAIFQALEMKRVAWGSWWGSAQWADAFSVWAQNNLPCES